MRRRIITLATMLALCAGSAGPVLAEANPHAPCIGENASTFAPFLRADFGLVVVSPEARAGRTGEVASTNARTECN